jgi:hypothetical protein
MEENPSREAKSLGKDIPRLLRNPKVRYHVHNSSSLVPILSHTNPVHIFYKVHFNIILPQTG